MSFAWCRRRHPEGVTQAGSRIPIAHPDRADRSDRPARRRYRRRSSSQPALASDASAPVAAGSTDTNSTSTVSTQTSGTNPVVAETVTPRTTSFTEGSSRFTWSGKWAFTSYSGYIGGRAKWSNSKGAVATFRFTGTRVSWIGPVGPTRGSAKIYLNGRYVKTVSTYSAHFAARRTLYTASWSTQAARKLQIVVVGTARHPTVAIDAVTVRSLVTVASPSPSPTPTPTPTPPPPPPPSGGTPRVSGPIEVTKSNVTIDGVSITSSGKTGYGIVAAGTSANPISNITIRNCKIKGFKFSILIRHAKNVVIENCTVTDADYAGIGLYSVVGGHVSGNTVQRIGTTRTNFSDPGMGNNAYGITLDRYSGGSLTSDPRSGSMTIDHNLIEDVPLWMGFNTHAGSHIVFSSNTIRRTPRAIFIAGDGAGNGPIDVKIIGNRVEQPVTKTGGTRDIEGILISSLQGGAITGNQVARGYGSPNGYDYGGHSTGITISGNVAIP